jgi:hypothetical protein
MPYTKKQRKLMKSLVKQYGLKKAIQVYNAMENSGKYEKIFGKSSKHSSKSKSKSSSNDEGKKPKLGTGERFAQLKEKLERKGIKNPAALAAWIGRKKYGTKKFQALAAAGRRRAS